MEITGREVAVSCIFISLDLVVLILLSNRLRESKLDDLLRVSKALRIRDEEQFDYGIRTGVGPTLCQGVVEAIEPVGIDHLGQEFLSVRKVTERYTRHTRRVTKTDSDGNRTTETEVYYTWDYVDSERRVAKGVIFLGKELDPERFPFGDGDYIETRKDRLPSNIRYQYYGVPSKVAGTMFATLSREEMIVEDEIEFYRDSSIEEVLELVEKQMSMAGFWIVGLTITIFLVIIFVMQDNYWLY